MKNQERKIIELFDKSIGDLIIAYLGMKFRPDYSAYHIHQCVEKLLKATLLCIDQDHPTETYQHNIEELLDQLISFEKMPRNEFSLSEEFANNCLAINEVADRIRYNSRKNDPDKAVTISLLKKAEMIMHEISQIPKCAESFNLAMEKNEKNLKEAKEIGKSDGAS